MIDNLHYIGVDYKSSSVEIREKFSFNQHELIAALNQLKKTIGPCVILSTCNRSELYLSSKDKTATQILEELSSLKSLGLNFTREHTKQLSGQAAAQHLFSVSAGLESMILGEGQVLNQVKTAYSQAQGFTDALLNQLFQRALCAGKKVRSQTLISRGAMSVPAAALQAVQAFIHPVELNEQRIMIFGSGEVSTLCLDHLHSQGASRQITLVSRSPQNNKQPLSLTKYGITQTISYQ
ncbi:MAG TPA: hypothetical protein V6C96_00905, partial [Vampirovibrionales bacterium]